MVANQADKGTGNKQVDVRGNYVIKGQVQSGWRDVKQTWNGTTVLEGGI